MSAIPNDTLDIFTLRGNKRKNFLLFQLGAEVLDFILAWLGWGLKLAGRDECGETFMYL